MGKIRSFSCDILLVVGWLLYLDGYLAIWVKGLDVTSSQPRIMQAVKGSF